MRSTLMFAPPALPTTRERHAPGRAFATSWRLVLLMPRPPLTRTVPAGQLRDDPLDNGRLLVAGWSPPAFLDASVLSSALLADGLTCVGNDSLRQLHRLAQRHQMPAWHLV